jgi:hypothetical protein
VGTLAVSVVAVAGIGFIVTLTQLSLRLFGVPEEHELIAGIFMAVAYGLFSVPALLLLAR